MPDEPNYHREAFLAPVNLIFLITALVVALLAGGAAANALLLFAAAAELLYLGTVPRNERFRRLVRARRHAERNKPLSDAEIFRTLSLEDQRRYVRFRNKEKEIKDNYRRLPYASQGLLDAHLAKLDGLLDSYLNLLQLKERHRQFAERGGEAEIARDIATLRAEIADDPPRVAAVKQRRLSVLEKRLDRHKKAKENLAIIDAQLETIEDVTRYVLEQSLTMQDPEEVAYQLDTLLAEVSETESSVQELSLVLGEPAQRLADDDFASFDRAFEQRERAADQTPATAPPLGSVLDPSRDPSHDEAARAPRRRDRS
ncbi:MAG: hypothetical protein ACK41D_06185 [Rubricoccaceae bacterium]